MVSGSQATLSIKGGEKVTSSQEFTTGSGLRAEEVQRLNGVFVQAMSLPAVRERMARLSLEPHALSAAQFAALLKADHERWGRTIAASGWKRTVD